MTFLDPIFQTYFPHEKKRIGIKMSGGADTGLLFYYTAKYIHDNNLPQTLTPFTMIEAGAPFQLLFSRAIIDYTLHRYPVTVESHIQYDYHGDGPGKPVAMNQHIKNLFIDNRIDVCFSGITAAPKNAPEFDAAVAHMNPPAEPRDNTAQPVHFGFDRGVPHFCPMINHDKRDVASAYAALDIMDLFERTRSCTAATTDFSTHCDNCWWCEERKWAFGKL